MSCSTRTAPCAAPPAAGAARAMIVRDGSRGGDSCSASGRAAERAPRPTSSAIAGMPDRLDVGPADRRRVVELQHLPRRVVGQLQPSLRIDDDDAFDHAGEDRFHPRAIARLLGEPASELLHRVVERARDGAELVVAVVEARRRQIAAAVAVGDAGDRRDAAADARREQPRDRARRRAARRRARSASRSAPGAADGGRRSAAARRARTRSPDGAPAPRRRACRCSAWRCSAATVPSPRAARVDDLGPLRVVLHRRRRRRASPPSRRRRGRRPR